LRLSDTRAERYLVDSDVFPPALRQRLAERDSHSLLEPAEGGLMVVVTDLAFEHTADTGGVAALWGYATQHSFVSARTHALHSADALRLALRDGLAVASGIELVAVLFDLRNDALRRLTTALSDEVNDIEDEILRGGIREQRERLGRVRRRCAHVRRHFAPDRNALHKLLARPPAWLAAADGARLRTAVEDLGHLLDDANELYERAKLLQEELAARLAEKTSDRLYVLSILSAVLLPMTLITGIFGMNVAGLPGLTGEGAFVWTMLLVFGSGAVTLIVLRWMKLL
jgi:zinc transporter